MFWLQSIQIPTATIRKVEAICADFIWRGGMHAISWDQLCRPREEGGVGLRPLHAVRKVACVKMAWRFIRGVALGGMDGKQILKEDQLLGLQDNNFSVTFKAILRCRPVLQTAICRNMKDGTTTDLWLDPWLGSRSLLEILGGQLDREAGRGLTCSRIIRDGVWRPEGYRILLSLPRRFALLLLTLASMRIPGAGPAQVRGAGQAYSAFVVAMTWFGPTTTGLRRWTSFGARDCPKKCNYVHTDFYGVD
ncbi:Uncharacterized protein M6B38_230205 [Iris pallida]|uniref:Reverse transcriptase n=1 Tax=Iris pallida TaxID=29817 RepID=A0AAX6DSC2_IRIPA|nr:Uncharacterized protein M6B38_230205 [Iris pallida]